MATSEMTTGWSGMSAEPARELIHLRFENAQLRDEMAQLKALLVERQRAPRDDKGDD